MRVILAFLIVILLSCQQEIETKKPATLNSVEKSGITSVPINEKKVIIKEIFQPPEVIIIPCSNGYDFEIQRGTLNPFLDKSLSNEDKIILKSFPYKKMKGSGYFGVYDKKNCSKIIENTNVDFLIMTKMIGGILSAPHDSIPNKWGYKTRILNIKTMEQKDGISGDNLDSYESMARDIDSKKHQMIQLILESWKN